MRKREYPVIIYLIISVIIYLLPLEGLEAEYSLRELARIHYDQARSYYRQGEYSKAKAEFQKVLRLQPEHQGAQWYFKCVEKELAKDEKTFRGRVEKLLKKGTKSQSREKDQDIEAILDSLERQQVDQAKQQTPIQVQAQKEAEKEQKRKPKEEERLIKEKTRAEEKLRRAKQREIIQAQKRAKKEQKHLMWERRKKLHHHLTRGKIHYYFRRNQRAIEEFKQVLLIDPEYQSVEKYISICQKRIEKQGQKGLQVKEKKEEEKKEAAYFLRKTSVELMEEEKESEKLEEIKQLYEKGKSYFQRGLYSEALDYFEKVIELGENP